jgi:penicillin-binding protein 1A
MLQFSPLCDIMNKMLQLVVRGGTGEKANIKGVKVGGKTGTTSGNADNWFVGFTPEYTCAVWHSTLTSGNIAPDIFADVFEGIEVENNNYPHIGNVISKPYCQLSGKLRGNGCKFINRGYYASNNLPEICDECK